MTRQNDERGRSPARRFPAIAEGESKADKVADMSTGEFRAWVKTLDAQERLYWREFRRKLSKDRYEVKRLAELSAPPVGLEIKLQADLRALRERGIMAIRLTEEEVARLEPEVLAEIRRERKRQSWRRWRERHKEEQAERLREQWERLKADPERYEEYLAKKREAMRRKRREAKGDGD